MLTSKQRAVLRASANGIDTIFQIGKGGINENMISQMGDAVENRELIKCRVLESSLMSAAEACAEVCERLGADPVQVIGTKFIIYKRSQKEPKLLVSEKKTGRTKSATAKKSIKIKKSVTAKRRETDKKGYKAKRSGLTKKNVGTQRIRKVSEGGKNERS